MYELLRPLSSKAGFRVEQVLKASNSASTDDDGLARIFEDPGRAMSSQNRVLENATHDRASILATGSHFGSPRWVLAGLLHIPSQKPEEVLSSAALTDNGPA